MTDHKTIAGRYIELWNRAHTEGREMLAENWTADARYADPLMSGDGHDGVDALIAGVQEKFPAFRFKLIGEPNGFGDHVGFSWPRPDGVDSPIKDHGLRRAQRRPHSQHHRVPRSGAGGVTYRSG